MYMTLLAAFQTLLHRYSGQKPIVIGTDIANRNRGETERLIGFFVNQLVLRTDLSGNPTFLELLGRVREVALGAYAHQDMPFESLVQMLQPERNLSRSPLFTTKFILQNALMQSLELPGLQLSPVAIERVTTPFDFVLSMMELPQGLTGTVTYSTDLFNDATIERMLEHFRRLLNEVATNPEQRLSDFKLLDESESSGLTVADFPDAGLSQQEFESLVMEITQRG